MKTTLLFLSVFLSANLFGQYTQIPDPGFEQALIDLGHDNVIDGQVLTSSISGVTSLDVSNSLICDLTGIEAFTSLTWLNCSNNIGSPLEQCYFTFPDFSQNVSLTHLEIWNCYGTTFGPPSYNTLDLSQNTALTYLKCDGSGINNLDVSGCTSLKSLDCNSNPLTTLDVSQNTELEWLEFGTYFYDSVNFISSIDLSQNPLLERLYINGEIWQSSGTLLDNFVGLTSIDLSLHPLLTHFGISCPITSIDLSQNPLLSSFEIYGSQVTSIDLSQNPFLTDFEAANNPLLTCLNVQNGNNLVIDNDFTLDENPNLICVQVDDWAWSTVTWMDDDDPQNLFSENCDYPASCFTSSLSELTTSKNLIQILDMMGRETTFKPNTPLIYVYDDGSTEKVFRVEY